VHLITADKARAVEENAAGGMSRGREGGGGKGVAPAKAGAAHIERRHAVTVVVAAAAGISINTSPPLS
jgi:hypothetical protein